jgi:uncharacterized protein DUF4412
MKAIVVACAVLAVVGGCNDSKKSDVPASGSTPNAESLAAAPSAPPSQPTLVQKALSFLSGGPFEGEIAMTMSDEGKPVRTIVFEMKGTKTRFDPPQELTHGAGYAVYDAATKQIITVSESQKMAFTMDMSRMNPGAARRGALKDAQFEKTGTTDVVAGYSCDVLKVTSSDGSGEVCVAEGIPFPMQGMTWLPKLEAGFPLRASGSDKAGKEPMHMLVTKIEKKSIDDARLQIPPGYRSIDLASMRGFIPPVAAGPH